MCCLPRLEEIVVPVGTAKLMALHAVPKPNQREDCHVAWP